MPWSAFPEHLDTPEEVQQAFPDDSQYGDNFFGRLWKRWAKFIKPYLAFSPRCTEWWAKWREWPIVLFAVRGQGRFRMEDDKMEIVQWSESKYDFWVNYLGYANYLSRIQYYTRWHFAIQWPLQITFHVYWKASDVPKFPNRPTDLSLKKMFYFYGPIHRDADKIYWLFSFFIGGKWK